MHESFLLSHDLLYSLKLSDAQGTRCICSLLSNERLHRRRFAYASHSLPIQAPPCCLFRRIHTVHTRSLASPARQIRTDRAGQSLRPQLRRTQRNSETNLGKIIPFVF